MVYFSGVELSDSSRPCSIHSGRTSQRPSMVQLRPLAAVTGGIARFSVAIEVNIIFSNKEHELNTLKLPKNGVKIDLRSLERALLRLLSKVSNFSS